METEDDIAFKQNIRTKPSTSEDPIVRDLDEDKLLGVEGTEEANSGREEGRQEFSLPPEAATVYKCARNARTSEARSMERSNHLSRCLDRNIRSLWSLNLDQWPDNTLTIDEKIRFAKLHQRHADERMALWRDICDTRAKSYKAQAVAYEKTLYQFCADAESESNYNSAKNVIEKLANSEKAKQYEMFQKRENEYTQANIPLEKIYLGASSVWKESNQNKGRRNRSRSRSPFRRNRAFSPTRGRGQARGRGRGRGGQSNSRGRGYPRRDDYGRDTKSGAHEIYNFTPEEKEILFMIRQNRNGVKK